MAVALQPVTGKNLFDCLHAMTSPEQWQAYLRFCELVDEKHVASNLVSMAQAAVHPELVPLAICEGDRVIGFLMYEPLSSSYPNMVPRGKKNNGYHICRFMIAYQQQGRGYGKAGMQAVIERLKSLPDCEQIVTSAHTDDNIALSLYRGLGFEPTGEVDEDEIVLRLRVR